MKYIIRTLIAAAVLFVLKASFHPGWREAVSALLISAVLCWVAARSRTAGVNLVIVLAGLYYIPQTLINISEGVLFDVIEIDRAPLMMARELGISLIMAIAVTALFTRDKVASTSYISQESELTVFSFTWRLAAVVLVFVICYFTAGLMIYPLVKSYYEMRIMPEPQAIACMQVLRACALLVAALPVLRVIPDKNYARLILAASFPVIGCIAIMIPNNDLMPPAIRFMHTIEMTPYYALYGFLLAYLFGPHNAGAA